MQLQICHTLREENVAVVDKLALCFVFVEILCVKHLPKHIPIENALIPIFVLGG